MNTNKTALLRLALLPGLALAGSGLMAPPTGSAQEGNGGVSIVTPDVEVTAYRLPTLLSETSQGVSVITREQITARNPASAIELIRDVPGLYVDQLGGPGGISNIHIRGSDPEHVLVLIDGVRVNDPMLSRGGSYDLSSLDLADVERIEVIRGSGSAIYGADAMGGVINIVTRRSKGDVLTGSVGAEGGGQGFARATGSVSGGADKLRYSANAATLSDGRDEDGGSLDLQTFSGSLSFNLSEGNGIGFFARHNDRESSAFPDFSGGNRLAVDRTMEQRDAKESTYGADFSLRPHDMMDFKFHVSRYVRKENIVSPGVTDVNPFASLPPFESHTDFTRDIYLVSTLVQLPLDSDLALGFEHKKENGINRSVQDLTAFFLGLTPGDYTLVRKTDSVFAELKSVPLQSLTVQLGIRHDSPTNLESETSPSAGVRYDFENTGTTLKAHYSEGFRPPSFFALGDPLVGDPALKSETSKGYEIGLEQTLFAGKVRVNLNGFETENKNLIDFDTVANKLVNRNQVDSRGAELELLLQPLDNLLLGLNHTYVETDIVDSAVELRNRPENRSGFTLRYSPSDAWQLSWTTLRVGEFFDSSKPTGDVKLDGYTRTDISASYQRQQITFTLAIDNLFDEEIEQFVGFVHPGVRARVGVLARF